MIMKRPREISFLRRLNSDFWHRIEVSPYLPVDGRIKFPDGTGAGRLQINNHLPRVLELTLRRRRGMAPDPVLIGRWCEPYPKQERQHRLTRRLIEVLAQDGFQAFILTRSPLILRDIDLLCEVNETGRASIAVVLPRVNRRTLKRMEPGVTGLSERFSTLERIKRSGIQTGILSRVIFTAGHDAPPDERELERLFQTAAAMFLDFIILLEPGADLPAYLTSHTAAVAVQPAIRRAWQNQADALSTQLTGQDCPIHCRRTTLLELASEYRIPLRVKRHLPQDYRRENYWVAALLANRAYQRKMQGKRFRNYLKLAERVDRLGLDIRNLIRRGDLRTALEIPDELWPDMVELTGGGWCDDEQLRLLSGESR